MIQNMDLFLVMGVHRDIQIIDGDDYGNKNIILFGNESKRAVEIELYKIRFNFYKIIKRKKRLKY